MTNETKKKLVHWAMFGGGIACVVVSVFCPEIAPILAPATVKLLGASAGTALILATNAKALIGNEKKPIDAIKDAVDAVGKEASKADK